MIYPTEPSPTLDPIDEWIEEACRSDPLPPYAEEFQQAPGPPLSPGDLRDARASLSKWHSPEDFAKATQTLCNRCGSEEWFNNPRLKFLHNAYVLAELVTLTAVERVRLADDPEQWPDGYVKASGKTRNIEITSTHGGRKLGDEYRGVKAQTLDPVCDWITRAEFIPRFLEGAIRAKSEKNYSSACWLVVYLNMNEYGIRQRETEHAIEDIKMRYAGSFEAISVLWKQKVY